jgi:hypothetical protein
MRCRLVRHPDAKLADAVADLNRGLQVSRRRAPPPSPPPAGWAPVSHATCCLWRAAALSPAPAWSTLASWVPVHARVRGPHCAGCPCASLQEAGLREAVLKTPPGDAALAHARTALNEINLHGGVRKVVPVQCQGLYLRTDDTSEVRTPGRPSPHSHTPTHTPTLTFIPAHTVVVEVPVRLRRARLPPPPLVTPGGWGGGGLFLRCSRAWRGRACAFVR